MRSMIGTNGRRVLLIIGLMLSCTLLLQEAQAQSKKKKPVEVKQSAVKTAKQEMSEHTDDLRTLMRTLYDAYPDELAKSTQVGAREMTEWVFDGKASWRFEAIRGKQQTEAISLVFDPEYKGDHILALVVGLETLLFNAYGGQNEYAIPVAQDESRLAHLRCQLEATQKLLDANPKQLAILNEDSSRQNIRQTLESIIQRISARVANKAVANSSC